MEKKKIGLLWVVCITSGAMIGSGLFVLPGLAFEKVGPLVFIPYLLASLLFIPALLSTCELATAMPKTGGIFFFSDRSMGPRAGMLGGVAFWLSISAKTAWALLGLGMFFTLLDPLLPLWQIKLIAIAACLVFMLLNLFSINIVGKFQEWTSLALLAILVLYIMVGLFFFRPSRIREGGDDSFISLISTTSLVFISYSGLTWITDMGDEVKNPTRSLPKGMIIAWAIVSVIYVGAVFVTSGVLDGSKVSGSVTPLTEGGGAMLGIFGAGIMTFAAFLAFVTTGNAGILTASRTPYAMSKDKFLPPSFTKLSRKGIPWVSVLATSVFMVLILLLPFEAFVRTASSLELITLVLACSAVLFMREARIKNYRPTFRSPFYPWLQILGIVLYGAVILTEGWLPLSVIGLIMAGCLVWYLIYCRKRIKIDYAILHIVKRIAGIHNSNHKLDEELREIIIERDDIYEHRFEALLEKAPIIPMGRFKANKADLRRLSSKMARFFSIPKEELQSKIADKVDKFEILVMPGFMIIPIQVRKGKTFEMAVVRIGGESYYMDAGAPITRIFIVLWSKDRKNLFLHTLMWIIQLGEQLAGKSGIRTIKNLDAERKEMLGAWHMRRSKDHYQQPVQFQTDEHPYNAPQD